MPDLTTQYLGLTLRSPIIAGSSGLTDSVSKIVELEEYGAGAVVLKSIFEEEITMEYEHLQAEAETLGYSDARMDYFDYAIREEKLNHYLKLISEAKNKVFIPLIASVNCSTASEWIYFAKKFEQAGADALELNIFIMPSLEITGQQVEEMYFNIIKKVKQEITIPLALKISHYFTNPLSMVKRLSESGIQGLVLFNRFYNPDFDVASRQFMSSNVFSTPDEMTLPLRWIAMASPHVKCDLAASTGIHQADTVLKMIMAGANVVEIASVLYKKGTFFIHELTTDLTRLMQKSGINNFNEIRGSMCQKKSSNPAVYERVQFMRYFRNAGISN